MIAQTTWNQRSESSDCHGNWVDPVNSNGVRTTANTMLIRFGVTNVPSVIPMAAPTSEPSTRKTISTGASDHVTGSEPSTHQLIGNITAAATSARSSENTIFSTATRWVGSGASSRSSISLV